MTFCSVRVQLTNRLAPTSPGNCLKKALVALAKDELLRVYHCIVNENNNNNSYLWFIFLFFFFSLGWLHSSVGYQKTLCKSPFFPCYDDTISSASIGVKHGHSLNRWFEYQSATEQL